jgi:hypothetical protein
MNDNKLESVLILEGDYLRFGKFYHMVEEMLDARDGHHLKITIEDRTLKQKQEEKLGA